MGFKSSSARSGTKLLHTYDQNDLGVSVGGESGEPLRPDEGYDLRISPFLTGYESTELPGTTLWDLGTMGALIIDGDNDGTRYTVTNVSSRAKHIQVWGQGSVNFSPPTANNGSPGQGGYSYGDFNLTVDTNYIVDLNQGGARVRGGSGAGAISRQGGGYGGLFEETVAQSNAIIMAGGGGTSGRFSAAGGNGGGVPGGAGANGVNDGSTQPGGAGGGSGNCSMLGGEGSLGGAATGAPNNGNWDNGGGGGGGYCGGGGGTGGHDPGQGTRIAGGGGGGSGYVNPAYTSNGVTDFYPVGQSDPNRGGAADGNGGPARIVFSLP